MLKLVSVLGLWASLLGFSTAAIAQSAPTISVQRLPSPMVAGQTETMTLTTTNTTSVTYNCTSTGTGFAGSGASGSVNGSWPSTASAAWVGYPSTCIWTATGPGGSTTYTENWNTVAVESAPTISVQRLPSPMVAGQTETMTLATTNTTSVTYNCTSTGTGFAGSGTSAGVNGSWPSTASAAWVGYPSTCIWTATGPGGSTNYTENWNTVSPQATTSPDLQFGNDQLLMHMDGANGSTLFTDVIGHAFTVNGPAQISTAQSMFGGASMATGNGGYISAPAAPEFAIGTNDFTVEMWVYPLNLSTGFNAGGITYQTIMSQMAVSTTWDQSAFGLWTQNGALTAVVNTPQRSQGAGEIISSTQLPLNTWSHVAMVGSGNTFTLYLNGQSIGSSARGGAQLSSTLPITIGADSGGGSPFNGYVDEVRFTNGVARYTGNFTPVGPFPSYGPVALPSNGNAAANLPAGQQATYSFTGSTGQAITTTLTNVATTPSGGTVTAKILNPDGSTLSTFTVNDGASTSNRSPTLAQNGTYTLVVSAGSNAANMTVGVVLSNAPIVNLTSPTAGQTIMQGAALTLTATATETGGTITTIAFYNGSNLLGTVTQSPYTLSIPNVAAGTYNITAQATDGSGLTTTSSAVSVTVTAPIPIAVNLINANFSANPTSTTYQAQAYFPAFTGAANGDLVGDASGNLYFTAIGSSTVQQIKPDGTAGMQWTGLSSPSGVVVAKDGSGLLASTSVGLMHLGFDGSITQLNGNTDLGTLGYSPSGVLYNVSYSSSTIYQISDTWQVTTFLPSGTIYHPAAFTFDDAGNMVIAANGTGQIIQVSPIGNLQTLLNIGGAVSVARYGSGWLIGTTNGPFLANAQWQTPTQLTNVRADQMVVYPNGKIFFTGWNVSGIFQMVATPGIGTASGYNQLAFEATGSVMLGATVQDGYAPISQVQFFNGNTSLGIVTQPPYNFNWSNITPGSYSITAVSTDTLGKTGTSAPLNVTVDVPSVSLTSPAASQTMTAPATIDLAATASNPIATITQVQFFNGSTLLATVTKAPYTFTWNNVAVGTYNISASATDSMGMVSSTPAVTISIPLTASMTSPIATQTWVAPAVIPLNVTASSGAGSITQVAFYNGNTQIGVATHSPFTMNWNNVAPGTYPVTASITDSAGNVASTPLVNVVVLPQVSVDMTSPTNGAQISGKNLTLSASATVSNANITQVAFYNGNALVGTTTQSPYSVIFPDFDTGTFTFTAQATDSFGTTTTSSPITVTVQAASSGTGTGSGSGEMVYDIHTDQLNTPRLITDASGDTVWQNDNTEAFGNSTPNESPNGGGSIQFNLRFAGQYADTETGTVYNGHRNYDPITGRYLESDPIGLYGGQASTYAYVYGSPLTLTDPLGLATASDIATALCVIKNNSSPGMFNVPPTSVTPIPDLHNFLQMSLQGYTDTSNNIQINATEYGDINTPIGFWNDRAFLQTLAHEWFHVQQSTFEKALTHGELHDQIDANAEIVSDNVYKAFREQLKKNKNGGGGKCGCSK